MSGDGDAATSAKGNTAAVAGGEVASSIEADAAEDTLDIAGTRAKGDVGDTAINVVADAVTSGEDGVRHSLAIDTTTVATTSGATTVATAPTKVGDAAAATDAEDSTITVGLTTAESGSANDTMLVMRNDNDDGGANGNADGVDDKNNNADANNGDGTASAAQTSKVLVVVMHDGNANGSDDYDDEDNDCAPAQAPDMALAELAEKIQLARLQKKEPKVFLYIPLGQHIILTVEDSSAAPAF
jgi:hypothetical protein